MSLSVNILYYLILVRFMSLIFSIIILSRSDSNFISKAVDMYVILI